MLIFSNNDTPRLRYTLEFFMKQLGIDTYQVVSNRNVFSGYDGIKINYSSDRISDKEIVIHPIGLLAENTIHPIDITCADYNGVKIFFESGGDTGFDMFAAAFYLLSRYEEYLPHEKDVYGRFDHQGSLAWKNGFLQEPMIDRWVMLLRDKITEVFATRIPAKHKFNIQLTYDIDEAWAYRNKSIFRNAGGLTRSVLNGRFSDAMERLSVLAGSKQDPYDAYDWMDNLHSRIECGPVYFIHTGLKGSRYDKNISPSNRKFRELVSSLANRYHIGIHPSWRSGDAVGLLHAEKKKLQVITGKKIISSRQHFIRFNMPATFRRLISANIEEDYSMGYGSINGFRASTCSSFYWFDLEKNEATGLVLHPFCFMDANSYFEQKQSAGETLNEMMNYYQKIKEVDGTMTMIWHNTFLGTAKRFNGWKEAYEEFLLNLL